MDMDIDQRINSDDDIRKFNSLEITLPLLDLNNSVKSKKKISLKIFANTLNHLHFIGQNAYIHTVHPLTGEEFFFKVLAGPCADKNVSCTLMTGNIPTTTAFEIRSLIVEDGKSVIIMPVKPDLFLNPSFTLSLQEHGYIYNRRYLKRFQCPKIYATIHYESSTISGKLEDFSSTGFRIRLDSKIIGSNKYFDNKILEVKLYKKHQLVFSGQCKNIRISVDGKNIVIQSIQYQHPFFKSRHFRNKRVALMPSPKAIFTHPFTDKKVTYEISDISNTGFSVLEDVNDFQIIPGMIIPKVNIIFSGGLAIECSVQIVYLKKHNRKTQKYGLAIFDINIAEYNKLFDIYINALDPHANLSLYVDMDMLWQFFFDTGFIYPKKYSSLSKNKEIFKETYEKLYHNSPNIFSCFTYQYNGKIYGHTSTVKAYDNTWMIHHLAAKKKGNKNLGLHVLNHIMRYFDGFCRMPSIGMDYTIFYFRPDNKFPDFFFGGFCRSFNNPKGCSMDCFAYTTYSPSNKTVDLPIDWSIQTCSNEDIEHLRSWYDKQSGGLMVDAFCLNKNNGKEKDKSVEYLYNSCGLKRKYSSFVLKYKNVAKAFIVVDESDRGLNLSDFLNSIKIIVTNGNDLPWNILQIALGHFSYIYEYEMFQLLIYPCTYLESLGISYERKYNLWVLKTQFSDPYIEYLKGKAQINKFRLLLKFLLHKARKS